MFIGHFTVGFAAKTVALRLSLGALFLAMQFVDLLWSLFILAGIEHVLIALALLKLHPLIQNHFAKRSTGPLSKALTFTERR